MDYVYILGTGSAWEDNELRYSLRSLEQFAPEVGNIVIVGSCPKWLQNITHIPIGDPGKNKTINVVSKIRAASKSKEISNEFVLMNDDFFFLKYQTYIAPEAIPGFHTYLEEHPYGKGDQYEALRREIFWMQEKGIETMWNFDIHYPMVLNKELLRFMFTLFEEDVAFFPRTIYGNLFYRDMVEEIQEDYKVFDMKDFFKMTERPFLSVDDSTPTNHFFQEWLQHKFPHPSKYEISI